MTQTVDTVLVCGAAGFIGSYAARELCRSGFKVVGAGRGKPPVILNYPEEARFIGGDLRDREFVEQLVQHVSPDKILFAAGPANVQRSVLDPVEDFANQLQPLVHVLWAASRLTRPAGVLLVSSAAVYGDPQSMPVTEAAAPAPISPYGFHKLAQEQLLHEFNALYEVPVCVARAFSTLGPGLRHLAVWDIAHKALNNDFSLRGTGHETRDYLYARDVGRALACITRNASFAGEVINVGSGEETPIDHLASLIYSSLGLHEKPTFDGQRLAGSPSRWRADTSRLRSIGFEPDVDLRAGVLKTIDWIKHHA